MDENGTNVSQPEKRSTVVAMNEKAYHIRITEPAEAIALSQVILDELDTFSASERKTAEWNRERAKALRTKGIGLYRISENEEARIYAEQSIELSRKFKIPLVLGQSLTLLGNIDLVKGNLPSALEHYVQSLDVFRACDDLPWIARTLNNMGNAQRRRGEYDLALKNFHESTNILHNIEDFAEESLIHANIGAVYTAQGRLPQAGESYQTAIHLARLSGNSFYLANALLGLGTVKQNCGDMPGALALMNESLTEFIRIGSKLDEASTHNNIGNLYKDMGEYSHAITYYLQALNLWRSVHDAFGESNALHNLGACYSEAGIYVDALESFLASLTLRRQTNNTHGEAITLYSIGIVHRHLGDEQSYEETLTQTLPIFRSIGDDRGVLLSLLELAEFYCSKNRLTEAISFADEISTLAYRTQETKYISASLRVLGLIEEQNGKPERALELYRESLDSALAIGFQYGQLQTLFQTGLLFQSLNKNKEAGGAFEQALTIANSAVLKKNAFDIHKSLAKISAEQGDFEQSTRHLEKALALKEEVFSEEARQKISLLQARYGFERVQREAEIERLRNVELAEVNKRLSIANEQLTELNREKNDFLGMVAHDLKNPLNTIRLLAGLMEEEAFSLAAEEIQEFSSDINTSSKHMFELIVNLLDINKIEQGGVSLAWENVFVQEILNAVLARFSTDAKNKAITIESDEIDNVQAFTDVHLLMQVLENLVSNAVKYSPPGKKIFLTAKKLG